MRRIVWSVLARRGKRARGTLSTILLVVALVAAVVLAAAAVASTHSTSAPSAPSQNEPPAGSGNPGVSPDSSNGAPSEGESGGDDSIGPGPEVGPEPSYLPDTSSTAPAFPATPKTAANIDTLLAAPLDTLSGAPMDTLRLPGAPPTTAKAGPTPGAPPPSTAVVPPKPRVGIFGLHPVAILMGLATLTYLIVKWASN